MLTSFGVSLSETDRWGYQPTLATVDQIEYLMSDLLKKKVLRVLYQVQQNGLT